MTLEVLVQSFVLVPFNFSLFLPVILSQLAFILSFRSIILDERSFLSVVEQKIVGESGGRNIVIEDSHHRLTSLAGKLCAIVPLAGWLVVVHRILDVDELLIWNVLNVQKFDTH